MTVRAWKVPVAVGDGTEPRIVIKGPGDALNFLDRRWPCKGGTLHDRARLQCQASLAEIIPADSSRKPFLAAMIEANLSFI